MEFTYATPALLFPAVSLLFLAYTTRFISYANLIRGLHERWRQDRSSVIQEQIENLRRRILLIRNMQFAGALSLFACVICMILLFFRLTFPAEILFGVALIGMAFSLLLLVQEIRISVEALDIQLRDMER